ncbi:MAG: carbohydrate kinase [Lunatimonas sp.]|uniref:carbohydrate kinase family protein n=1 Tax=Lunatimonas sp. TaxID=2060141 RepID=UPI00263BB55F|nr:carbohydrate kinase [Lunatimonas sp.]MCC5938980.1 carbohydrate kinase [Lunatimonas sp.]
MPKKAICFGEMLWDVFPKKKIAGGAPMNVALHLQHLGLDTSMISRVGKDKLGRELFRFVERYGLDTSLIQEDGELPTGTVHVNDTDPENIQYDIVKPAAWDRVTWNETMQRAVRTADVFVYGSLAAREPTSRETLFSLLKNTDSLKVLDMNLRPPFYTAELIEELLKSCHILKINEEELSKIASFQDLPSKTSTALERLSEQFDLDLICVTLGAKGALLFQDGEIVSHPGYPVEVADTVGSGDAFLAGFITKYLDHQSPEQTLDYACALGALVATMEGGTPTYAIADVEALRKN